MTFTLPFPPSTNNLYATVRGRRVLSAEGRRFKQAAAAMALSAGVRPLTGDVSVALDVYRPRRAGDLDNTIKATLDALKGIAWADDSQVTRIVATRFEDKRNPRVDAMVLPSPDGLYPEAIFARTLAATHYPHLPEQR